jgi:S1-C subfamily serine protease
MAAKTEQFKSAGSMLGRTIGQSLSMIRGKDVANYSLLFMDPTADRKRGEHQTIFMPHIVLGRSSKCHVRYSDEFRTVSREHASITIDGNRYILHHNPSASNPTYVNGSVVGSSYELQNGDEMQLSSNGPRIRFNVSTVKTSTIGLTNRIGAAMAQAARPYKRAIAFLTILLIFLISGFGYYAYDQKITIDNFLKDSNMMQTTIDSLMRKSQKQDSINTANDKINKRTVTAPVQPRIESNSINLPDDDVYFIEVKKVYFEYRDSVYSSDYKWVGTGFLTDDGYFVTARHVIQPWRFPKDNETYKLSVLEAYGAKINAIFTATSMSGRVITFSLNDLAFDDSTDELMEDEFEIEGKNTKVQSLQRTERTSDWAFFKTKNLFGKCKLNPDISTELKMGQKLYILGFSYGSAMQSYNGTQLKPLYSESNVAQNGITNGLINTTNRGFGSGNSGGPVFIYNGTDYDVIGIVSASYGSELGIIVPISNIFEN